MSHPFITFSPIRVKELMKRGWQFYPMSANETPNDEKGVLYITMNNKHYKAKKKVQ